MGLLHIGSAKAALSKRQKEFNRLTEKIAGLTLYIAQLEEGLSSLNQRVNQEMRPLLVRFEHVRVEMVWVMDRLSANHIFGKNDILKLDHMIADLCFELITKNGRNELTEVFDRHSDQSFATVNAEIDRLAMEAARNIATVYGVDLDTEGVNTPDEFREYMASKLSQQDKGASAEPGSFGQEERAKTRKQQVREEKRKLEESKLSKSVRTVYMDLVKAFHPDREQDENEKARKTEIMQRVTEAYQQNDLMKLLQLQMEFQRIDQDHLERLADDQLTYFNKVLKQQLQDLEIRKTEVTENLADLLNMEAYRIQSVEGAYLAFNHQLAALKKHVKNLKSDLTFWNDAPSVKAFLKTYKIPERHVF